MYGDLPPPGPYDAFSFCRFACGAYDGARQSVVDFAHHQLAQARFPLVYAAWSPDERVAYWTTMLYRQRRRAGEDGVDEDSALTPELVEHMRRTDPAVDTLLPAICERIARMDGVSARTLLQRLTRSG